MDRRGNFSCWEEGTGWRLMESRLPISPLRLPLLAEAEYTEQGVGETRKNGPDE